MDTLPSSETAPQIPQYNPVAPPKKFPVAAAVLVGFSLVLVAAAAIWYVYAPSEESTPQPSVGAQPTYTAEPTTLPTPANNGTPLPSPVAYHNSVTFTAHTAYPDLSLFPADSYPGSTRPIQQYEKIGTFTAGPYAGADLVRATVTFEGPGGPAYYRFAVKGSTSTLLVRHSSEYWIDPNTTTPKAFSQDGSYLIAELYFPPMFTSPDGKNSFKIDEYVRNDWDDYINNRPLRKVFNWPGYGDVFTEVTPSLPTPAPADTYRPDGHGFYIQAPDGSVRVYELRIPFVTQVGTGALTVRVTWSDGSENTKSYSWVDVGGCGARNYASVVAPYQVADEDLLIAGTTSTGESVWALKDSNHPFLKQVYNTEYYGTYDNQGHTVKMPYEQFAASRPVFFWRDSFGRLIKFLNADFVPQAECDKPVIYLYPQETEYVSVRVEPRGGITKSDPDYGQGWFVQADPNGHLFHPATGKEYPYLFWEGKSGIYDQPTRGWSVAQSDVRAFLDEKLAAFGLNASEISDFKDYWLPLMNSSPYYFITFLGTNQMNDIAPLTIKPRPDTVIRVLMDYSPLSAPIDVKGFTIHPPARIGFTVVEWGGVNW